MHGAAKPCLKETSWAGIRSSPLWIFCFSLYIFWWWQWLWVWYWWWWWCWHVRSGGLGWNGDVGAAPGKTPAWLITDVRRWWWGSVAYLLGIPHSLPRSHRLLILRILQIDSQHHLPTPPHQLWTPVDLQPHQKQQQNYCNRNQGEQIICWLYCPHGPNPIFVFIVPLFPNFATHGHIISTKHSKFNIQVLSNQELFMDIAKKIKGWRSNETKLDFAWFCKICSPSRHNSLEVVTSP